MTRHPPDWLKVARELSALGQTGLAYTEGHYDRQRYDRLLALAAEITGGCSTLDTEEVEADFRAQLGYATPKVDVRGAVVHAGKVLLVQERSDRKWCLPGGWADVGCRPSEMVEREVREESQLVVRATRLVGVYDVNADLEFRDFYHAYKLVFSCEWLEGEPGPSDETSDARFFAFDELPDLSARRTHPRHLEAIQRHLAVPDWAVEFD